MPGRVPVSPGCPERARPRVRDVTTYVALAVAAGLDAYTIKLLVNHSRTADVTLGYVTPSMEHLRAAQERVTTRIAEKAGGMEALLGG